MKPLIALATTIAACFGILKLYRAMREMTQEAEVFFCEGLG